MKRGDVVEVVLPAQTTVDVVEQTTSLIEVPLATVRGLKGDAATVAVGSVTTGEPGTAASVTNSGTPGSAVFNFVIPRGDKGEQGERGATGATGATGAQGAKGDAGEAATVTVGSVETGAEGTPVIITNTGTAAHAVFNFRIPVGATGAQGARGLKGDTGEQGERGEQGLPGEKGEKGETGEAGAKGDKGDPGTPGEKGDKGDKGDTGAAGHTPVRGTDYWTSADQSAIVSDVQASLGDLAMRDTITHTQVSDWDSATSSFLTEHQSLDGLATEAYVDAAIAAITDADSKSY